MVRRLPGWTGSNIEEPTDQGALAVDRAGLGEVAKEFVVLGSLNSRDPGDLGVEWSRQERLQRLGKEGAACVISSGWTIVVKLRDVGLGGFAEASCICVVEDTVTVVEGVRIPSETRRRETKYWIGSLDGRDTMT